MSSLGLRFFSGITVGLLGEAIGIHASLALAASSLFVVAAGLRIWLGRSATSDQ